MGHRRSHGGRALREQGEYAAHLLRTKLSFLGANRFDPRGERWVRVTFFQGAPLIEELNSEPQDLADFDDWSFPLAPTGSDSQAASENLL